MQLTPEQQKYWPAIESAIRAKAQNRQPAFNSADGRNVSMNAIEGWRNRDAVAFLNRRADALHNDPPTLRSLPMRGNHFTGSTPEQKQRMGALTIFVLRDMSDVVEQRTHSLRTKTRNKARLFGSLANSPVIADRRDQSSISVRD